MTGLTNLKSCSDTVTLRRAGDWAEVFGIKRLGELEEALVLLIAFWSNVRSFSERNWSTHRELVWVSNGAQRNDRSPVA